jgi:hypothetical protein
MDWRYLYLIHKTRTRYPHRFKPSGSESSILSLELQNESEIITSHGQEPDPNSPLVWRNFVNDHSVLQFLEERAQNEPLFQEELLGYIEHSKRDKKWRIAASNASTILVRSRVQFINTDLQGIRIPGADLSYGVFGEPENLFRESSKKLMAMASVVSKLKQPSDKGMQDPFSNVGIPSEQTNPQVEETDDS